MLEDNCVMLQFMGILNWNINAISFLCLVRCLLQRSRLCLLQYAPNHLCSLHRSPLLTSVHSWHSAARLPALTRRARPNLPAPSKSIVRFAALLSACANGRQAGLPPSSCPQEALRFIRHLGVAGNAIDPKSSHGGYSDIYVAQLDRTSHSRRKWDPILTHARPITIQIRSE